MKFAASALRLTCIAAIGLAISACGGAGKKSPLEAYRERKKEGKIFGEGPADAGKARIAIHVLPPDAAAKEFDPRGLIERNNIDVLVTVGAGEKNKEALSHTGDNTGHRYVAGLNGLGVLSRYPVTGQEGDLVNYPFDGFLLDLPRRKSIWALVADTSLLKPLRVESAMATLLERANSHAPVPVAIVVAFRASGEEIDRAARGKLAAGGWTALSGGAGAVEIFVKPEAAAGFQAASMDAPSVSAADFSLVN